jgi:hypothetical protein
MQGSVVLIYVSPDTLHRAKTGDRGNPPGLSDGMKIYLIFQLLEKYFHLCPSILYLSLVVINETGHLWAMLDCFIPALFLH